MFVAPERFFARQQRTYVENRGATVEDQFEDAAADCERLLSRSPDDLEAQSLLGQARHNAGEAQTALKRPGDALASYRRAAEC
jgi:hypothetical protein